MAVLIEQNLSFENKNPLFYKGDKSFDFNNCMVYSESIQNFNEIKHYE